jgi:hypothetical protein
MLHIHPPRDACGARYGVVLDLHFVQKSAAEFGLRTQWDVAAFEVALLSSLESDRRNAAGGAPLAVQRACIAARVAADSMVLDGAKRDLQQRLEAIGYVLELSPNKTGRNEQVRCARVCVRVCVRVFLFWAVLTEP